MTKPLTAGERWEYTYRGDRFTDSQYKGQPCKAVRRNGKCIRGKNSNMLVEFEGGKLVVLARQLRKLPYSVTMIITQVEDLILIEPEKID